MPEQFSVPQKSDKPSLGNAEVVLNLLTSFESELLALRASFFRGAPGAADPKQRLLRLCAHYGDIFEGKDASFDRPEWGRTTVAGMRKCVAEVGDPEAFALINKPMEQSEVGKAFFVLLAKAVMQVSDAVENGMEQRQATARMNDINDHMAQVLMGNQSG